MAYEKKKPNVKCKFSGCINGNDRYSIELNGNVENGPKWTYACAFCKRNEVWKTIACSPEHFELYQQEILESRAANRSISTTPIMSDMTDTEYQELMVKPIEQVEAETKQELSDMGYAEEVESLGISGTVDLINSELAEGLAEDEATANENVNDNTAPKSFNFKKSKVKD